MVNIIFSEAKKKKKKAQRATIAHLRASMSQNILNTSKVSELFFQTVKGSYLCSTWLVDGVSPSVFRCTSTCHGSATRYRSEMEMQVS